MSNLKNERNALRDAVVSWSVEAAELKREVERLEARVAELEADPRMALTLDELEALVTGYGFWWRGPDETRSPSPLTDKAVTVLERMRAALAAEGKP